jgi:hypothetical protein
MSRVHPAARWCALIGVALLAAGCGSSTAAAARTRLDVTYWAHGKASGHAQKWRLNCRPSGGTHPHPRTACRELANHPGALRAAQHPCTLGLVRGAALAEVKGHVGARAVDRSFRSGCDDAFRLLPVLLTGGPG